MIKRSISFSILLLSLGFVAHKPYLLRAQTPPKQEQESKQDKAKPKQDDTDPSLGQDEPIYKDKIIINEDKPRSLGDSSKQQVLLKKGENKTATSLSEVIEKQRGIKVNRFGAPGSYSSLSIRGANPNQVGIYIDGINLNNPLDGWVNLEGLPLELFKILAIHRSHTPIELNGTHIGGAINLIPRTISTDQELYFLNSHATSLLGGSLGLGAILPGMLHYVKFEGSENRYDYYDDNGTSLFNTSDDRIRRRENEDYNSYGYTGLFSFLTADSESKPSYEQSLKLLLDFFYRERGIPGVVNSPLNHVRLEEERGLAKLKHEISLGSNILLKSHAALVTNDLSLLDSENELPFSISQNKRSARRGEVGIQPAFYFLEDKLSFQTLLDIAKTDLRLNAKPMAQRLEQGLGTAISYEQPHIGDILIQGKWATITDRQQEALRDNFIFNIPNLEKKTKSPHSRSVRLSLQPLDILGKGLKSNNTTTKADKSWLEVYTIWSYGERAPSIIESYGNGYLIVGNLDLKPEVSTSTSYGVGGSLGSANVSFDFSLAYFQTHTEDLILFTANSPVTLRPSNLGAAFIYGIENELGLYFGHYIAANFRFTYLRTRDEGKQNIYKDKELPFRPRFAGDLHLEGGTIQLRPFVQVHWLGSLYRDRQNSPPNFVPSRVRYNAGLSYYFSQHKKSRLSFIVKNIKNEYHSDVVGYPLPNRSYEIQFYKEFSP